MTWTRDFRLKLASGKVAPKYLLEWVKTPAGSLRAFGGNIRLSSFVTQGYAPIISISDSRFNGGDLRIRDWVTTPLTFDIAIMGESRAMIEEIKYVQRGQIVVLKIGFGGDPTDFDPVALGTIMGISRSGAGWVIRCKGLEGSLASRIAIEANEQTLGFDLAEDTLRNNLTSAATEITVDDASDFRTDGQGVGAVRVTANDGSEYFCTYTALSVGTGPGGSDELLGATIGTFGTTHSTTGAGNVITEVMYTSSHPLRVLRRILTSTGTAGSNGPDDILPASWGFGIPAEYVADRDIVFFIDETQPASGTGAWHWVKPEEITDPQTELQAWAAGGGHFLTQHRGQLTARSGLRPWLSSSPGHIQLTDAMIIPESIQYEAWDPDSPVEYVKSRFLYGDGTDNATGADSETDHIPGRLFIEHTLGGIYSDSTNGTPITTEALNRISHWDIRVAEKLMFSLRGWWPGIASPGDTVELQTTLLTGRDGETLVGKQGLITRCAPDWFGATTEIELLVLPVDEWVVWAAGRV